MEYVKGVHGNEAGGLIFYPKQNKKQLTRHKHVHKRNRTEGERYNNTQGTSQLNNTTDHNGKDKGGDKDAVSIIMEYQFYTHHT